MKTVKNVLLPLFLLLLLAQTAIAQRQAPASPPRDRMEKPDAPKNPEERAAQLTQRMTEKMGLNEQQTAKVAEINRQAALQMQAIHQEAQANHAEKQQKMAALRQKTESQLRQVLNSEQMRQLEQMRQQREERMEKRHDQRVEDRKTADQRAAERTLRMSKNLNLNDAQTAKVKDLNLQHAKAMDAIHQNERLEREQRQQQVAAEIDRYETELNRVLTTEQQQKMAALKAQRKAGNKQ